MSEYVSIFGNFELSQYRHGQDTWEHIIHPDCVIISFDKKYPPEMEDALALVLYEALKGFGGEVKVKPVIDIDKPEHSSISFSAYIKAEKPEGKYTTTYPLTSEKVKKLAKSICDITKKDFEKYRSMVKEKQEDYIEALKKSEEEYRIKVLDKLKSADFMSKIHNVKYDIQGLEKLQDSETIRQQQLKALDDLGRIIAGIS